MLTPVNILYILGFLSAVFGDVSPNVALMAHFTAKDKGMLIKYFNSQMADSLDDPGKIYHILLGLTAIDASPENKNAICAALSGISLNVPSATFYHTYGLKRLQMDECKPSMDHLHQLAQTTLAGDPSVEDLFFIVMALKEANLNVDASLVLNKVDKIRAKDSSPTTLGYIFQIVSHLNLSKTALKPFVTAVPNVLSQADELDEMYLYFDKGLYTTAVIVKGLSDLIIANKELSGVTEQQLVKLINYIYSRLSSHNLRAIAHLIDAFKSIASNPQLAAVVLKSNNRIAHAGSVDYASPTIQLQATNLWGDLVYGSDVLTLKAGSLLSVEDPKRLFYSIGPDERGLFESHSDSTYRLSLAGSLGDIRPLRNGLHELEVSAQWNEMEDKRALLGVTSIHIPIHLVSVAEVLDATLTLSDSVGEQHLQDIRLQPPQRYVMPQSDGGIVDVMDGHQLSIKLRLVDQSYPTVSLTAHQMFLQVTHAQTGQAITFVFNEVDPTGFPNAKGYIFHLNPSQWATEFDNIGGVYKLELIMGDSFIKFPLLWHMATVRLHFTGTAGSDTSARMAKMSDVSQQRISSSAGMRRATKRNPLLGSGPEYAKPELEHLFRTPERLPHPVLSWTFSIACALPILCLPIGWLIIGINARNFRFNLSTLIFYSGLTAIFVLYYFYWCYLDMFTTLRYLALLLVPTFIAGTSMLRCQLSITAKMK